MDNRNRDKMGKDSTSSNTGNVNRDVSKRDDQSSESDASFGKNIGRNENLENEPSRRSGNMDSGSSVGHSSRNSSSSDIGNSSGGSMSGSKGGYNSSSSERSNLGEQSDPERDRNRTEH